MKIIVGITYWENRDKLIEEARRGELTLVNLPAPNNHCYFCSEHIEGGMILLARNFVDDNDRKHVERYCSCRSCFREIKTGDSFIAPLRDN